ncbi:hypothetical protein ACLKA6_017672 [Drosophila palustris]
MVKGGRSTASSIQYSKIPALIWAHIRDQNTTRDATNEFVVIAHNSPYTTYSERRNLCKDVRRLLEDIIKLQHNPNYGLLQCCRTSEIAHKLDIFQNLLKFRFSCQVRLNRT